MIDVLDEIKNAYEESAIQVDRIILDGEPIRINNVSYDDDCYDEGNIFGTAIARSLDFEIENSYDLEAKEFEYQTGVYVGNEIKWTSLGNFITYEIEPNETTDINKIYASDYMLKSNILYETALNYQSQQVTVLDVLEEACKNSKIELATKDFPNSDFIVDSNQFTEDTLIRQVFQAVAQISGTFAKIKSDNKLYFIRPIQLIKPLTVAEVHKMRVCDLSKTPVKMLSSTKKLEIAKYPKSDYSEVEIKRNTHPINMVSLGMSNVEGENIVKRDEESISKDGENSLVINDNPFAYTQAKREKLITKLFEAVKGFEYTAFSLKGIGKPYFETGDAVEIVDSNGEKYRSFLFRYSFKSPNGLESTLEAPSIIKATVAYQNIADALEIARRTEIIVDKLQGTITSIVQEQTEQGEKMSQVEQTVDGIEQEVKSMNSVDVEGNNLLKNSQLKKSPSNWESVISGLSKEIPVKSFQEWHTPSIWTHSSIGDPNSIQQAEDLYRKSPYKNNSIKLNAEYNECVLYQKLLPTDKIETGEIYSASINAFWTNAGLSSLFELGIAFVKNISEVISQKTTRFNFRENAGMDDEGYLTTSNLRNKWFNFKVSAEVPADTEDIYYFFKVGDGQLYGSYADMILNKGTPTSWQPAPDEELSIEEFNSLVKQTADEIRQEVEAQDGRINQFTQNIDSTVSTISKDVLENLIQNSDFKVKDNTQNQAPANFEPTNLFSSDINIWKISTTNKTPNGNDSIFNGSASWEDSLNLKQTIDINLENTDEEKYFTFSCVAQYYKDFTEEIAELDIVALDEEGSEISNNGYVERNFIGNGKADTWYEISIVKQIPNNAKKLVIKLMPKQPASVYFGDLCLVGGSKVSNWKLSRKDYSTIAQTAELISLTVQKGDLGTLIEQNYEHVKIAWNKISKYIQYEDSEMRIYDNDELLMSLGDSSLNFYSSGKTVSRFFVGNTGSHIGTSISMDNEGDFITLGLFNKETSAGTPMLSLARKGTYNIPETGILLQSDMYGNAHSINNVTLSNIGLIEAKLGSDLNGNGWTFNNIVLQPNDIKVDSPDGVVSGLTGYIEVMTNFEVATGIPIPMATFHTFYFTHGVLVKVGDKRTQQYTQLV